MTVSLHISKTIGLTLAETLQAIDALLVDEGEAIALLYTPTSCKFGRLRKGSSLCDSAGVFPLKEIYEARVFNEDWELRWLNDPAGKDHRTVLLSDQSLSVWPETTVPMVGKLDRPRTYLLWGKMTADLGHGWKRLTTARIGALDVPFREPVPEPGLLVLEAVEYLREFEHGNIAVAEERLTGLKTYGGIP